MRLSAILLFLLSAALLASCAGTSTPATTSAPPPSGERTATAPRALPPPPPQRPVRPYEPGTDPESEARLRAAVEAVDAADLESAAVQLKDIADDTRVPNALRAESLRYLGRVQVGLGQNDAAVETMVRLIELEPPIIELDPDVEPPPLMQTYYEARREADGGYAVRSERPQTMAIVNFTNSSITDKESWDPMQQGFASLMIHAMGPATDLKLVERERIRWLLEEHNLQSDPSLIDQATAVRAGRLLGAQTVIFGSFIINRRDLLLSARLVDVETGEILFSEQARGRADDFDQLVENLSLQVARTLNVELASTNVETRSLDAALSYSEGLALIEQGDYRAAQAKFMQALEYDPDYSRARQRVHSLQPMIAAR